MTRVVHRAAAAPLATKLTVLLAVLLAAAAPSGVGFVDGLAGVPVFAGTAYAADDKTLVAGSFDPARIAPDFSLRGSDGAELTLSRYRGKVVVLYFGFTTCTTICPTTLATLARARKELGAQGDRMQVVYITVDPERDDAERLRAYVTGFDPTFVGGTGTGEQLSAVRDAYGIAATRVTTGNSYEFAHSSSTYLIDPDGKLRALMPYGRTSADYVHDVKILLER